MTDISGHAWFRDPGLQRVLALLNEEGGAARIVGGAVRNSLMGLEVSDLDIATTLLPDEVQARAEKAGIKCVPTGIKHGTVTLVVGGRPFEVTTLRRDVATDGRHAEVEFTDDWSADAARRDLTINALYADAQGIVHDYTGGLADIETATIRFIGSAAERIEEDHLRILRFFRFFAYYGRGRPDADGLKASAAARRSLARLSAERIWAEMKKLLSAPDPFRALLWMRTAGVLTEILPETEKWGIDAIPGLVRAESAFGWAVDPLLRLAAMVPPVGERLDAMASRLKLSGSERRYFASFAAFPAVGDSLDAATLRRLLFEHGRGGAQARLRLAIASAVAKEQMGSERLEQLLALDEIAGGWSKPEMPVKGNDLASLGYEPGPTMGEALERLQQHWIESDFSLDRARLLALLQN